jgi:hypothetical protein
MELWEFPNCCGGAILEGLNLGERWDQLKDNFVLDPEQTKKSIHHNVLKAKNARYGFIIAVTNQEQKATESLLESEGFVLMREATNPLHNSHLKIWYLDLTAVPGILPEVRSNIVWETRHAIPTVGVTKDEISDYYDLLAED